MIHSSIFFPLLSFLCLAIGLQCLERALSSMSWELIHLSLVQSEVYIGLGLPRLPTPSLL